MLLDECKMCIILKICMLNVLKFDYIKNSINHHGSLGTRNVLEKLIT